MENIQEKFFSKNNISLLNNKLLENLNVKNLNEKQRVFIAQTIVDNMKKTWKTIDISKIRPENFQSVLSQFNSIAYKNTFEEIAKLFIPTKKNVITDPISKKYERDFQSNPNNGVTVNNRPISITKNNNSWIGPNEQYVKNSQDMHKLASQPDRNLDNLFRPIVDEIPEEVQFNNYTVGRGGDFKEKLQDIQRMRDTEVPRSKKAESDLPNFLKSKSTSVRSQEEFVGKKNINHVNNKNPSETQNIDLNFIDGIDDNENLYSLDNIDKPLINEDEYEEDQAPFSDRLNKLKSDRDNIQIPQQKSVDFKSDDFNDDFNNIQPTRIDKLKNKNTKINDNRQEIDNNRQEFDDRRQQINDNRKQQIDDNRQQIDNNRQQINDNRRQQINDNRRQQINDNRQEFDNNRRQEFDNNRRQQFDDNKKNTNKIKQSNKLTVEQREIFDKLKLLNKNLMSQLSTFKENNNQLRHDNLELAEKLQEIIYKEELLKEKEKELDEKYGSIINTKNLQLEINPESSISNYRYNFINTINVSGIKLTSCSIPFKKYNIEYDINNLFLYTINNIEKNIILSEGYHTIQEIIDNLNLNQNDLIFELNSINQKIKVISESKFNIVPTTLSIVNLGFKSNYNNDNIYNADTIYDLRINNRVYLFFKNISDEPISIITPNTNIYDSELLFEKPVKLNYLDIIFKDENDNKYNFYNISHYIHLNLMVTN
jgi:hypothetical protein